MTAASVISCKFIFKVLKIIVFFHVQDNTFQVVMATDGEKSFVFFTYIDIQWGEGGVGFDAGDGMRSYNFIGSRTGATQNLEEFSNVGVDGVYAFRVDLQNILSPGGERRMFSSEP